MSTYQMIYWTVSERGFSEPVFTGITFEADTHEEKAEKLRALKLEDYPTRRNWEASYMDTRPAHELVTEIYRSAGTLD